MKSIGTDSLKVIIYFIKFLLIFGKFIKRTDPRFFGHRDSMDIDKCVEKEGL